MRVIYFMAKFILCFVLGNPSFRNRGDMYGTQHDGPFRDIPVQYRLSVDELHGINESAQGKGNFAKLVVERLFPELFGPDNLRWLYNYNGGGARAKKELDPKRKEYLVQYVLFMYPELQEKTMWASVVVNTINEGLRRPRK
jgi:hypothetical protein